MLQQIRKARFKLRDNIALKEAENSLWYEDFRSEVAKTILKQSKFVSQDEDLISDLLMVMHKEADHNVTSYLRDKMPSFFSLIGDKLAEFLTRSAEVGGQAALDKLNIDSTFQIKNNDILLFLQKRSSKLVSQIDETTRKQIATIIRQGRDEMLTTFEIAQKINLEFADISLNRSQTIAFNELANAANVVERETMKRNGVSKIRWITVQDDRVSERCRSLHGQVRTLGYDFLADDGWTGPGPQSHVNCRCFIERVIEGFEPVDNTITWTGG